MLISGDLKVDYYVTTRAELDTVLANSAATLSGKVCFMEDGDYTGDGTRITLTKACTNYFVIIGRSNTDTLTPGWVLTNSSYIQLRNLNCYTEATNDTQSWDALHVIEVQNTNNIYILDCEVSSNDLSTITMQDHGGSPFNPNYFQGYTPIGNTSGTANYLTVRGNYIHDGYRPISGFGQYWYIYDNYLENVYQNFITFVGSDLVFEKNIGYGIWANAGSDPGQPHSSLFAVNAPTDEYRHLVRGNILICGPNRTLAYPGTTGIASGPKWNDTGDNIYYHTVEVDHNIFVETDNIGLEISLGDGFNVHHNLIAVDTDVFPTTTNVPSLNYHDISTGSKCWNNIFCGISLGSQRTIPVDSGWFTDSYRNVSARAVGMTNAASGDKWTYPVLFTGPTFTGITPDNVVAMFTPIAGTVVDGIGPIGTGYNFTTGAYVAPTYSKPTSDQSTGTSLTQVQFDGTAWIRCTDTTDPFIGMSDGDVVTAIFVIDSGADGVDRYIFQGSGDALSVRLLPTNFLRFKLENSSGTTIVEVDSGFELLDSDGATVWTFSFKISTYQFWIMKGYVLDGMANVSVWKSGTWDININQLAFMSSVTGTNIVTGGAQAFWLADTMLTLSNSSAIGSVVALDGLPSNWGSDGKTLSSACKAYLAGDATAWNSDTLNLADAAYPFVMTGTVT